MGLFKSDKNPCPICGGPTPRIFPFKIDGQPLCKDCDNTISMEDQLKKTLTLALLKEHLEYRKQNAEQHKTFLQTRVLNFNDAIFLKQKICVDDEHGLWYLESGENSPIFRMDELVSFCLKEDNHIVIKLDKSGYKTYPSAVDGFMNQYGGFVGGLFAFSGTINRISGKEDKNKPQIQAPIDNFNLEFAVNNRYWQVLHGSFSAPDLLNNDIPEFIKRYTCARSILDTASQELLSFFPQASTQGAAGESRAGKTTELAEDLKKFKDLLDMGIITQAEFDAKKGQLLGL
ncbi:MAG TPA: SHOCT domain-containing protein [Clostridia bacterium]|nr:SHOCT domain-containing protein [Clostridia bacterium]